MFRSLLAASALLATTVAHAQCVYEVRGRIDVDHQIPELIALLGHDSPLEDIKVKVSTRRRVGAIWGNYSGWPSVRTNANGEFVARKEMNCLKRQIKVSVKFDDSDLELRHATSTSSATKVKWYEVYRQLSGYYNGAQNDIDIGTRTFRSGGSNRLGDFEPRRHADLWVLIRMVLDEMSSLGYPFVQKLKVKYPHDGIAGDFVETSYANPINHVLYLHRLDDGSFDDGDNTATILHELMHMWAYDYSRMENSMAYYLLGHLQEGTHGFVDRSFVAFHEGFAEHTAHKLLERLFDAEHPLPLSRHRWRERTDGVVPGDYVDAFEAMEHKDDGWQTVFEVLEIGASIAYDYSTSESRIERRMSIPISTCEPVGRVGFRRLLHVMAGEPGTAFPDTIHRDEMEVQTFLERAAAVLTAVDGDDVDVYMDLLDPDGDLEPMEDLCTPRLPSFPLGW